METSFFEKLILALIVPLLAALWWLVSSVLENSAENEANSKATEELTKRVATLEQTNSHVPVALAVLESEMKNVRHALNRLESYIIRGFNLRGAHQNDDDEGGNHNL